MRRIKVRRLRGTAIAAFAALTTMVATAGPAAAYQAGAGSGRAIGGETSALIDPDATVILVDFRLLATAVSVALACVALTALAFALRRHRRSESTSVA